MCVRLYKCSKKFSSKKIWYGSFSYIKGLKNYINEKVPCSVFSDFPLKKQNFSQKKSAFVAHRKSAFCSQKKRFSLPGKKMLCSHRKGCSLLYIKSFCFLYYCIIIFIHNHPRIHLWVNHTHDTCIHYPLQIYIHHLKMFWFQQSPFQALHI